MASAAFSQYSHKAFETASVKTHEGQVRQVGVRLDGVKLQATTTALGFIMFAYNVRNRQVDFSKAEPALNQAVFDIDAQAVGYPPTRDEFRQMLQTLLAERFHLQVHREKRDLPVYALVAGKAALKFQTAEPNASAQNQVKVDGRNYQFVLPSGTMANLVDMIESAGFLDRTTVDQTGLTGTYHIELTYTPDLPALKQSPDPHDVPLRQAIEDQLGLKLEARTAKLEVLVIDRMEKPLPD